MWVEALVDCPGSQRLYTYSIPQGMAVQPGCILSVPFGSQQLGAIAIHLLTAPPPELENIKAIADVVSTHYFPPHYWVWLDQIASYYHTPLIKVINTALPPGLLGKSQHRLRLAVPPDPDQPFSPPARAMLDLLTKQPKTGYTWQYLQKQVPQAPKARRELAPWLESYLELPRTVKPQFQKLVTLTDSGPEPSPRHQEILQVLRRHGGELPYTELLQLSQTSGSTVNNMAKLGLVTIQLQEVLRTVGGDRSRRDHPKTLTPAQAQALEQINALRGFHTVLLHGVTGSGKTEVYLQAIAPVLTRGQSALVLVPEIGLVPQLTDRFSDRFGSAIFVYHSGLSEGERYDTWRQMLTGQPQVVIGTRSAVFAPLPKLGLIILDEEHDPSFKQDQPAPCYHARTIAQWRAQLAGCPLILGSATPALETWAQIDQGLLYLALPERIHQRPQPQLEIIDMRQELLQGNRSLFSLTLQSAIHQMLNHNHQGILFVPRRGHSTFVSCRSCGYVMQCPHCDVSLSYHYTKAGASELLRCHYCNYVQPQPDHCPACNSSYFRFFGSGTQKVTQEIAKLWPGLRVLRFDSDTTRTKDAHRILLDRFSRGDADLLVGTQMITKGLDLDQVTLVGVIAADGLLHMSDFRSTERAYQVLTQVAGRSGRGNHPGRVVIQTYSPDHPVIQALQNHNYAQFCTETIAERTDLGYPPAGYLTLLRVSGPQINSVQASADRLATHLQQWFTNQNFNTTVLGPAPAPIPRLADRFRWQILLKSPQPCSLPPDLQRLCDPQVFLSIDVDPLHM